MIPGVVEAPGVIRDAAEAGPGNAALALGATPVVVEVDSSGVSLAPDATLDAVEAQSDCVALAPDEIQVVAEADSSGVDCPGASRAALDAAFRAAHADRCGTRLARLDCQWHPLGHREHCPL